MMIPATGIARRNDATLVVVDVQDRLAKAMPKRTEVIAACGLLLECASIIGAPVVITRQNPGGLGELDETLAPYVAALSPAQVTVVDKMTFDCFEEPAFCDALASTGRGQLVLCGMESHICVTQTALAGLREGLDVHVVADACCSRNDGSHAVALSRLTAAGAVNTTAESAAYELIGRAGTDEFRALLAAVKRR